MMMQLTIHDHYNYCPLTHIIRGCNPNILNCTCYAHAITLAHPSCSSVVLVSIRQILLVIVLFLERILESSLVLVLGGSNTCK